MKEIYKNKILNLAKDVHINIDNIFNELDNKPFHIISFPSIEKKNILLHCLIGHEIGHLIARDYINDKLTKEFSLRTRDKIKGLIDNEAIPDDMKGYLFYKPKRIQYELEISVATWRHGLGEILSDIFGAIYFGPAILFSSFDMSLKLSLDHDPYKNELYPPWIIRLKWLIKIIEQERMFPLESEFKDNIDIFNAVNNRYNSIKKEINKDSEFIKNNKYLQIVYEEIERDIGSIINDYLSKNKVPKLDFKIVAQLIERLKNGITPNASDTIKDISEIDKIFEEISRTKNNTKILEVIPESKPATIPEIINAAWFFKIWRKINIIENGEFNKDAVEKRDTLNRLTLKAIEYSDLANRYPNN